MLGFYAQDVAYYLEENFISINVTYILTAITILSILFFIVPHLLVYNSNRKNKNEKISYTVYFYINILTGVFTSVFSLFVMIMWWG